MEVTGNLGWRKSSYSGNGGNDCVEVGTAAPSDRWHKSSYSGNGGTDCVEVGTAAQASRVFVRDSKDRDGAALAFGPLAWRRFTDQLKD